MPSLAFSSITACTSVPLVAKSGIQGLTTVGLVPVSVVLTITSRVPTVATVGRITSVIRPRTRRESFGHQTLSHLSVHILVR